MPKYIDYSNREEWLKGRIHSLGASEVASVLGMGFQNPIDVWEEKTGVKPHKEFKGDKRVDYGSQAEEHLRCLFALKNKGKYEVEYFPYRTYFHEKYGFLHATLDGELTRIEDAEKGVWECKTVFIMSRRELEEWEGKIPNKYYIQVLDQMAIMNYKFAVITAEIISSDGNSEIRNYTIERTEDVENDIRYVIKEAVDFWTKYVIPKKKPPIKMIL